MWGWYPSLWDKGFGALKQKFKFCSKTFSTLFMMHSLISLSLSLILFHYLTVCLIIDMKETISSRLVRSSPTSSWIDISAFNLPLMARLNTSIPSSKGFSCGYGCYQRASRTLSPKEVSSALTVLNAVQNPGQSRILLWLYALQWGECSCLRWCLRCNLCALGLQVCNRVVTVLLSWGPQHLLLLFWYDACVCWW